MAALKKTPLDQKRLGYPKITPRAAAQRAQRHVPDSIATLRYILAHAIVNNSFDAHAATGSIDVNDTVVLGRLLEEKRVRFFC
jgi:hypothetical protein